MILYQSTPEAKLRREKAQEAISLAMESQWDKAVEVNSEIIHLFPDDLEANNRLGKAFFEKGNLIGARAAFQRTLELAPNNSIARKNLNRLANLKKQSRTQPKKVRRLTPHLFIEESGKTVVTALLGVVSQERLVQLLAGDPVTLSIHGSSLTVDDSEGNHLGTVEPRLAPRLIKLINGGNRYESAIINVTQQEVVILIREAYRSFEQCEIVSFPIKEPLTVYPSDDMGRLEINLNEDAEVTERISSPHPSKKE